MTAPNSQPPLQWLLNESPTPIRVLATVSVIILALPLAVAVGIWSWWIGGSHTTPQELAEMLRRVASGTGWDSHRDDWDELDSVPLRDARLEAIRQEAATVELPLNPEGRVKLTELAERAEAVPSQSN